MKSVWLVCVFFAFCGFAYSTTVVAVINKDGIAVLADSKTTSINGGLTGCPSTTETRKVVIIQERFALASLGADCFHYAHVESEYELGFELPTWRNELQGNLPKDVSFDQLAEITKDKFSELMPKLQIAIASGEWGEPLKPMDIFEPLITFFIAGYDNGVPRLSVIKFYIDWKTKTVLKPYLIPINLGPPELYPSFRWDGVTDAAANIQNPQSYAYKQAMATYPKTFSKFVSGGTLSLDESITIGQAMIEIEEKISPITVAGPVRGVKILPNGRATELADFLPKTEAGKHQQKH
jgi:hypothetical protein